MPSKGVTPTTLNPMGDTDTPIGLRVARYAAFTWDEVVQTRATNAATRPRILADLSNDDSHGHLLVVMIGAGPTLDLLESRAERPVTTTGTAAIRTASMLNVRDASCSIPLSSSTRIGLGEKGGWARLTKKRAVAPRPLATRHTCPVQVRCWRFSLPPKYPDEGRGIDADKIAFTQPAAISKTYSLAAKDVVVIVRAGRLSLRGSSAAS